MDGYKNSWENELLIHIPYDTYVKYFNNIYACTQVTKLRDFQYRLLLRKIVLNTQLFRWNIHNNKLCRFCETHDETITHFFYNCSFSRKIWDRTDHFIREEIDLQGTLDFSITCVLFNTVYLIANHLT